MRWTAVSHGHDCDVLFSDFTAFPIIPRSGLGHDVCIIQDLVLVLDLVHLKIFLTRLTTQYSQCTYHEAYLGCSRPLICSCCSYPDEVVA